MLWFLSKSNTHQLELRASSQHEQKSGALSAKLCDLVVVFRTAEEGGCSQRDLPDTRAVLFRPHYTASVLFSQRLAEIILLILFQMLEQHSIVFI